MTRSRRTARVSKKRTRTEQSASRATGALPAKLIPPLALDALPRPRLFGELDRRAKAAVTWLHGPAGAGKTLLLATYLRSREQPTIWYSLDLTDHDVSGFFHHALRAAQQIALCPIAAAPFRMGSQTALRAFTRRLFETLFAALPPGACWVLDDFQDAASSSLWSIVFCELLAVVPPHVRVLVASRTAPPRALARFTVAGRLSVLGWQELRFDEDEVRQMLGGDAAASERESADIQQQTQGWAVAVSLLARANPVSSLPVTRPAGGSMQPPAATELNSFFDFLAAEVFEQLTEAARTLLLSLCLFPSFTHAQAVAMSRDDDVARVFEDLLRESLLIERYATGLFRIHDLFRHFLREHMRRSLPIQAQHDLFVRAALLLEGADTFQPATELLSVAQNWQLLAERIQRTAPALAERGQMATLRAALEGLPHEFREQPWLLYWSSVCCLGSVEAAPLAERAFRAFEARAENDGVCLSWALLVQAIVLSGRDMRPLAAWLPKMIELPLQRVNPMIATRVAWAELFVRCYSAPADTRTAEAASRAVSLLSGIGKPDEQVLATCCMAMYVYCLLAQEATAYELRRVVLEYSRLFPDDPLLKLVSLQFDAMLKSWVNLDLLSALAAVHQALELGSSCGIELLDGNLRLLGTSLALGRGDVAAARSLLGPWRASARGGPALAAGPLAFCCAWEAFESDDVNGAERWMAESLRAAERLGMGFPVALSIASMVVFAATRGDEAATKGALEQLELATRRTPVRVTLMNQKLAQAYAALSFGQDARTPLVEGLRLAAEEGLTPILTFSRRMLGRLLVAAIEHEIEVVHVSRLIAACGIEPDAEAWMLPAWPWPIRIRVLGRVSLSVGGREVRFGRKPPAMLLALLKLLAAQTEPISRARVLRALWPGYVDAAPRGTLDTALYRLRKLLSVEAAIEQHGDNIQLSKSLCWTDTRALSLLCERLATLRRGDTRVTVDELERCERILFDVYRGPFAVDDELRAFVRARDQLRRLGQKALTDLGVLWLAAGRPERQRALSAAAAERESNEHEGRAG
jgi:ATP/maltotriose-dependent transcriptional regulator MalT